MEDSFCQNAKKSLIQFESLHEFSKNSYMAQMIHLIVPCNRANDERILKAVLEKSQENVIC